MPTKYVVHEGDPYPTASLAAQGDGRRELEGRFDDGARIYAVVKDGKIMSFEGTRDGQTLETKTFQVEAESLKPQMMPVRCMVCILSSDGSFNCYPIECPGGR
ncbi:hypothetical protein GCM10012320_18610 [Sinomonas cellulolyticus]|jgi:hypothetical protein|uniref:Uncharacterized protein n=1 Tax=Sinomonas cellulolyticus TaxID=2801916 RepID=A0ABS1K6C3_9MICC|nr:MULTISPECIES: hypothetical protein [Sinomonas]MBL0707241.1 hypothetical protein [Sinomonas cellulolyticus]GHG50205.1 hypothetical protein GCM10012320_18610 [Sinomonas sp. KCTC 49339]